MPEFFVFMGPLEVFTMLAFIALMPMSLYMMGQEAKRLLSDQESE